MLNCKFISDSHVHSDNSPNATDPVVKLCETASDLNLYSITIINNCECDSFETREYKKALKQSNFEARKAHCVFKKDLSIFSGIELGQPHKNPSTAEEALSCSNFDFVLAAVHKLDNLDDFSYMDYSCNDIYSILDKYFDEILDVISWGNFDSLAHLNYPLKYITERFGIEVDSEKISQKTKKVLKELAKKRKALEINTSSNNLPKTSILSNENLISEFYKAGGKLVTLGSGAHNYKKVGSELDKTIDLLNKTGFTSFTVFKKRSPMKIKINKD